MVAKRIFDKVDSVDADPSGFALVVVVLAVTAGLFLLGRHLARRRPVEATTKGATRAVVLPASVRERRVAYALFGGVTAVALLPHLGVVLQAFAGRWFMTVLPTDYTFAHLTGALSHELAARSVRNSLLLSLGSTALTIAHAEWRTTHLVHRRGMPTCSTNGRNKQRGHPPLGLQT